MWQVIGKDIPTHPTIILSGKTATVNGLASSERARLARNTSILTLLQIQTLYHLDTVGVS